MDLTKEEAINAWAALRATTFRIGRVNAAGRRVKMLATGAALAAKVEPLLESGGELELTEDEAHLFTEILERKVKGDAAVAEKLKDKHDQLSRMVNATAPVRDKVSSLVRPEDKEGRQRPET